MSVIALRSLIGAIARAFEHAAVVGVGFVLMVVGLGLGVTMIMLPVGLVLGLIGVAMVVGGVFARLDDK